MSYEIAEYKYINHMKDRYGLRGDLEYPSRTRSAKDYDGNWLLISPKGVKMGKVFKNGSIIA